MFQGGPSHTQKTPVRSRSGQVPRKAKEPGTQGPQSPSTRPGASRGSASSRGPGDRGRAARQTQRPQPREAGQPRPGTSTEHERRRAARLTQRPQPREAGRPRPDSTAKDTAGGKKEGGSRESSPAKSRTRKTEEWGRKSVYVDDARRFTSQNRSNACCTVRVPVLGAVICGVAASIS